MEMAAKEGRKMSPSFFGREEDSNPPGLGPGDTRGRTEAPDHFHGECSITSNARDCGSRLCGCNFRHSPQFQRDVAQEQSAGLGTGGRDCEILHPDHFVGRGPTVGSALS